MSDSSGPSRLTSAVTSMYCKLALGSLLRVMVWLRTAARSTLQCEEASGTCTSQHQDQIAVLKTSSVMDLRRLILSCGLSVSDCIEKTDLQERAWEALTRKSQGRCLAQRWVESPAQKQGGPTRSQSARFKKRFMTQFKSDRQPSRGSATQPGSLQLTLLPYTPGQASKAPTVVLQNLIRHFGWSSSGLADKAELVQYALQALRQPKPFPKPHMIRFKGHMAHVLTPKRPRMTKALPLLIVLHGAGRSKESVDGFVLPFSRISSRQNALVAIPMSLDNTWDLRAAVATGQASADTAFISHIIDCLMRDYRVDAGRIALMGFSDGGSYALSLAVSNPGVFQAAMSWSAGYYQNAPVASAASSSLPHIFHAHGRADELFNFEKVALPMRRSLRSSGHNVTSHNVLSAGHSAPSDFASLAVGWWLDLPDVKKQRSQTHLSHVSGCDG